MMSLRDFLLELRKYHLADARVKRPGPEHVIRVDRGLSDRRPAFCQIWARCPDDGGQVLELQLSSAPHDEAIRAWVETHGGSFSVNNEAERATFTATLHGDLSRAVSSLARRFGKLARGAETGFPLSNDNHRLCRRIRAELLRLAGDLKAHQVLKLAGSPDRGEAATGSPHPPSRPTSGAVPHPVAGAAAGRRRRRRHEPPAPGEPDLFAILEELPATSSAADVGGTGARLDCFVDRTPPIAGQQRVASSG
jgi:hypothetical protein